MGYGVKRYPFVGTSISSEGHVSRKKGYLTYPQKIRIPSWNESRYFFEGSKRPFEKSLFSYAQQKGYGCWNKNSLLFLFQQQKEYGQILHPFFAYFLFAKHLFCIPFLSIFFLQSTYFLFSQIRKARKFNKKFILKKYQAKAKFKFFLFCYIWLMHVKKCKAQGLVFSFCFAK